MSNQFVSKVLCLIVCLITTNAFQLTRIPINRLVESKLYSTSDPWFPNAVSTNTVDISALE